MHVPVLLKETIENLNPQEGETLVDGTVGLGGHARALGEHLGQTGKLIGIDQDEKTLKQAEENLSGLPCQVILAKGNFRNIKSILSGLEIGEVDSVLLDIGFSSEQLQNSGRGFSFQTNEPLLMTLSTDPKDAPFTAREIINDWDENNIADIIFAYGEETFSRQIAEAIVKARREKKIETTGELVEIIRQAVPSWYTKKRLHFATKTFQALRIATNDELGALKQGLEQAFESLKPGGRLGVISFHSLEARIIKNFMKGITGSGQGEMVIKKAIKPTREEIIANPRARSAQLRIIKKLKISN